MEGISEKLAGIGTEDLLEEVNKRSEFYIGLSMYNGSDGKRMIRWTYKGEQDLCVGLCETLKIKISDHKKEARRQ